MEDGKAGEPEGRPVAIVTGGAKPKAAPKKSTAKATAKPKAAKPAA